MPRLAIIALVTLALSPPLLAQSNISSTSKFAWSENCGYLNFRDAGTPAGNQGVLARLTYMSGMVWGENIGWINVGSAPGPYANTNNTNYGVNINASTNVLSGFAWAENVGWINFSGGALATPPNPARIAASGRFRGYAWGENIGWINLDDAAKFVALACPADFDRSGTLDPTDVAAFVNAWFAALTGGTLAGDFDDNGVVTPADVAVFVSTWFAALTSGC